MPEQFTDENTDCGCSDLSIVYLIYADTMDSVLMQNTPIRLHFSGTSNRSSSFHVVGCGTGWGQCSSSFSGFILFVG